MQDAAPNNHALKIMSRDESELEPLRECRAERTRITVSSLEIKDDKSRDRDVIRCYVVLHFYERADSFSRQQKNSRCSVNGWSELRGREP